MRIVVKGTEVKLSENFTSTEFDCHGNGCCDKTMIDDKLIQYCQNIREHFGKPVTISSGYRCAEHNKAVGGANKSKHRDGMAADIIVSGVEPKDVAKYAESIGIKGIGLYETDKDGHFVHIDTRTSKSFWYGQGQEYRETFGGHCVSVKEWQKAAIADGFKFPKYGADGSWGAECASVAKIAICKQRLTYKYKNLTKIVQKAVGVDIDGKFGAKTKEAVQAYQRVNGLTADGAVGINTWKKILGV